MHFADFVFIRRPNALCGEIVARSTLWLIERCQLVSAPAAGALDCDDAKRYVIHTYGKPNPDVRRSPFAPRQRRLHSASHVTIKNAFRQQHFCTGFAISVAAGRNGGGGGRSRFVSTCSTFTYTSVEKFLEEG